MVRWNFSSPTTSSESSAGLRRHGWLWTVVGSLMLLALLWGRPDLRVAPTLAVFGLGVLDVVTGAFVLRRAKPGRTLLVLAVAGHLTLAGWLGYRAHVLAASIESISTPMNHEQMVGHTAGTAMLGLLVWFTQGLAVLSTLLGVWTAVALVRSR